MKISLIGKKLVTVRANVNFVVCNETERKSRRKKGENQHIYKYVYITYTKQEKKNSKQNRR